MKKKMFIASIVVTMSMLFTACSGDADTTTDDTENNSSTTQVEDNGEYIPEGTFNFRVFASAGGIADTVTRINAQSLQDMYGVTTVVENLTGANGAVAVADMDSYDPSINELSVVSMSLFTTAPLMNPDLNTSIDNYTVVGSLIKDEFVLLVSPDSGIENMDDLLAYADDNQIIYGSNTPGGSTHVIQTALFGEAGVDAQALTSDGSNKDILAVLSGDAICAAATTSLAATYVESGDVVPILIFSENEYTGFDGITVPSAVDEGYDITLPSYNYIITRSGVEQEEADDFYDALLESRETENFAELAEKSNYIPDETSGEELENEIAVYAEFCEDVFNTYYQ